MTTKTALFPVPHVFSHFVALCAVLLFALWVVGQVARDATWVTGIIFYVPSVVIAATLAVLAVLLLRSWRVMALAIAFLALPPLVVVFVIENHWMRPVTIPPHNPSLTLVHWNVYHGKWGWRRVREQVVTYKPDLCIISETPNRRVIREDAVRWFGPERAIAWIGTIPVIASGSLSVGDNLMIGGRAHMVSWRPIDVNRPVLLLEVDLPANIYIARHPLLEQIHTITQRIHPDLIIGDLNAPRRPWALARLPEGYAHAYDLAGWSYTRPLTTASLVRVSRHIGMTFTPG